MIVRIPLDDTNSRVSLIYHESAVGNQSSGAGSQTKTENNDELRPSDHFENITTVLNEVYVPAYASPHYPYPVKEITVTVPDDDKPVVASWFGNSAAGGAASDTLVKRMTTAVFGAMSAFWQDAARTGLFTRPFRLGYALLTNDGKLIAPRNPILLTPNDRAPVMAIRTVSPSGDILSTLTEIRNRACELRVSLPAFSLPAEMVATVRELVFYVTDQCSPLTGDEQVTAVRTYVVESGNCPGWYYPRLSADTVAERALRDKTFRIIGRIPLASAMAGISGYRLPDSYLDLTDFKSYPEAKDLPDADDPYQPSDPDNPDRPRPTALKVTTNALDLGMPEAEKRVRAVTARGIFSRHPDSVTITLYGSHHRPADELPDAEGADMKAYGSWRKIARARGPHISLLRGLRYRWLRVEVSAPYPARIDALTFVLGTPAGSWRK